MVFEVVGHVPPENDFVSSAASPGSFRKCDGTSKMSSLRSACLEGVPERFRASFWLKAVGDGVAADVEEREFRGTAAHVRQLDRRWLLLVERTLGDDGSAPPDPAALGVPAACLEPLSDSGREAVARVLRVFRATHSVDFCPLLERLTPRLLLYCSEGACYHILDSMWQQRSLHFPATRADWAKMSASLPPLIERFYPKTFAKLAEADAFREDLCTSMTLRVFEDLFQMDATVRILDAYVLHGAKMIFRALLGLLKLCKRAMKRAEIAAGAAAWAFLADYAQRECVTKDLMAACFGPYRSTRPPLRHRDIASAMDEAGRGIDETSVLAALAGPSPSGAAVDSIRGGAARAVPVAAERGAPQPLDEEARRRLAEWLPPAQRGLCLRVVYDSLTDGKALSTLYRMGDGSGPRLLVVEASEGGAAGVFTTVPWRPRPDGYGSRENFIFRVHPVPAKYAWAGREEAAEGNVLADQFMVSSSQTLAAGGSRRGADAGLQLDADLTNGFSSRCETYGNEPLFGPAGTFTAARVVLYDFVRR